jgi:hypothetical protein
LPTIPAINRQTQSAAGSGKWIIAMPLCTWAKFRTINAFPRIGPEIPAFALQADSASV